MRDLRQQDGNAYHRNVVVMTFDILLDRFESRSKVPVFNVQLFARPRFSIIGLCYHSITEA